MKRTTAIAVLALAALGLAGCSTVSTPPDQIALHYEGGITDAEAFIDCIEPSVRDWGSPGDKYFSYPLSRRTYDASDDPKAERGPITVVSSDNAEMKIPVSITFEMVPDCDTIREFHENIGNRNKAYWGGTEYSEPNDQNTTGTPAGWIDTLNFYVGKVLDTNLDRAAQEHGWRAMWNDPKVKAVLEQTVEETLQAGLDQQMGGRFFLIDTILLQKPDPVNIELKEAVAAEQAAVARANAIETEAKAKETSAVAEAKAKQAGAEAEIAVAKAEAAQIEEQIRVLGLEGWIQKYGIDNGITPWPNPVVPGANATK